MRVLLTGATGFIGSHVARTLLASSCEVYALIRSGANLRRISEIRDELHIIAASLSDQQNLQVALNEIQPQICIHLAWFVEHGAYWHSTENLKMLSLSLQLAQLLLEAGCPRIAAIGTCAEYDRWQATPLSESTSTLRPDNLYAASKLSLYFLLEQLAQQTSMNMAWLRLFYLYGPQEDENRLVPHVINKLLSGKPVATTKGTQVRDYLHVADVASAIVAVALGPLTGAVNIGSGEPLVLRDMITKIAQLIGREDLVQIGTLPGSLNDPPYICADNQRLISTSWHPQYSLDEGLAQTIQWWQVYNEPRTSSS